MEQTLLLMDSLRCEQLWLRHADRLLLYATTVLSDRAAAEDVLQNVFVRLMALPPESFDSEAGYLFRAVRNEGNLVCRALEAGSPANASRNRPFTTALNSTITTISCSRTRTSRCSTGP